MMHTYCLHMVGCAAGCNDPRGAAAGGLTLPAGQVLKEAHAGFDHMASMLVA